MKHRYSFLISPLKLFIDCLSIFLVIYFTSDSDYYNLAFIGFIISFWTVSTILTKYYQVLRFTKFLRLLRLATRHYFIFTLGFFAFFGIYKEGFIVNNQFLILTTILITTFSLKILIFFSLKWYRNLGRNFRKVVVIGIDDSSKKIITLFNKNKTLGYKYLGCFSNKIYNDKIGSIEDSFQFIIDNSVDEIYCSLKELNSNTVSKIRSFSNSNNINLKLIPDSGKLYSKDQSIEFYDDTLVVLNVKKLPFEFNENYIIKRVFDFFLAVFVCLFIMSWLIPILWVLIKIESKGPAIFSQKREGVDGIQFICYKFRSMKLNNQADKVHAVENDNRVTRLGALMRKTSIDELPQFFNVLKGDMSVVGPRPHLPSLSSEYQKDVDDYLKRHLVKPGITGLAQVSGYRGEIKKKSDIKNRVRLDVFYIENWSFLLDVKIILMTVFNVFKGDENAY
ncbi:exopolysaccharide biosynthesis polyprenyl glycosylphosphotransferase [Flavobacteriaceae bacterium]|nr:exopolysaccharide biosynthesis polyprenyl glycosylphosphotransferase [Flavobacteriaceae bacterium]MDB4025447.1 exopolysaccharide biosynthesis polyprenyl glycosylphosphotransferase [Flavobacteriaceae bacterium]